MKQKEVTEAEKIRRPFSILLRIVRGETPPTMPADLGCGHLSVSSYGSCGVKRRVRINLRAAQNLSVSSYGSCGVKPTNNPDMSTIARPFSILLRIVRGETSPCFSQKTGLSTFSILLRIVRGETFASTTGPQGTRTFQYPLTDRAG